LARRLPPSRRVFQSNSNASRCHGEGNMGPQVLRRSSVDVVRIQQRGEAHVISHYPSSCFSATILRIIHLVERTCRGRPTWTAATKRTRRINSGTISDPFVALSFLPHRPESARVVQYAMPMNVSRWLRTTVLIRAPVHFITTLHGPGLWLMSLYLTKNWLRTNDWPAKIYQSHERGCEHAHPRS